MHSTNIFEENKSRLKVYDDILGFTKAFIQFSQA